MNAAPPGDAAPVGVEILEPGPFTTVQDLGRPGLAGIGVGGSGAADRGSLRLANRLVGNDEGAAALEMTLGGARLLARGDLTVAVTGAPCAIGVSGRSEGMNAVVRVPAGALVGIGVPERGLRSYLAVRGGLEVPPVLGSRSTDVLAALGPPRVTAGCRLPVGRPHAPLPAVELAPVPGPPEGDVALRVRIGPRDDWFRPEAIDALLRQPFEVSVDSNRVGMRLLGPELRRLRTEELPSEGTVTGSIQCPPHGRPTLFLADHPVTGGYPVVAVVLAGDIDRAAQVRPGQRVRFRRCRR